jgi:hypothetical protein
MAAMGHQTIPKSEFLFRNTDCLSVLLFPIQNYAIRKNFAFGQFRRVEPQLSERFGLIWEYILPIGI